MQDRAPTKPNRYAVYDDAHNFIRYEYHERADEPTQAGDALNKANLLPDAVATALGLTGNPQVKDALEKIKTLVDGNTTLANSKAKIATGSYTGTGTYGASNKNNLAINANTKLLIVRPTVQSWNHFGVFVPSQSAGATVPAYKFANQAGPLSATLVGETLTWFDTSSPHDQFNHSDIIYEYICFIK